MIEMRHLRHLAALDEHRHFGRAAEALGITQPALTRSIQSLEGLVQARLFDRGRGALEPTAIGLQLLAYAGERTLAERDLLRDVELLRSADLGQLRIGAGPFAGAALVGAAVGRLSRLHPRLQLEVVIAPWQELPARLAQRDIDLMLAELSQIEALDAVELTRLLPHPSATLCRAGHPLTRSPDAGLAQLLAYPWAGPQLPREALERLQQLLPAALRRTWGSRPPLALVCDSAAVLKDILLQSDALSMMPIFMAAAELRAGQLVTVAGLNLGNVGQFGVARLRHRLCSPVEAAFIEVLVALDAELRADEEVLLQTFTAPAGAGAHL